MYDICFFSHDPNQDLYAAFIFYKKKKRKKRMKGEKNKQIYYNYIYFYNNR